MKRILITGAAGSIGRVLRTGLRGHGFSLSLSDIAPLEKEEGSEIIFQTDISDLDALKQSMSGVDCVVHLAGIPREASWESILAVNIDGTFNVFEAARQSRVKRVIFASSNHAVGFYRTEQTLDDAVQPRPNTFYGVSKVVGEALGRLYADKHGLSVACLRIGSFQKKPCRKRHLRTWVSHRDLVQLVLRCIQAPSYHFIVVYGVSANDRSKWDNSHVKFLGYQPEDNAEAYAAECTEEEGLVGSQFHGGDFCAIDFDGDASLID